MTTFAGKINLLIPNESERTRYFFNCATTTEDSYYVARLGYGVCGITCSAVNVFGYSLSFIVTSVIHIQFQTAEGRNALHSFYFTVGMTALLFTSLFNPSVLKLNPTPPAQQPTQQKTELKDGLKKAATAAKIPQPLNTDVKQPVGTQVTKPVTPAMSTPAAATVATPNPQQPQPSRTPEDITARTTATVAQGSPTHATPDSNAPTEPAAKTNPSYAASEDPSTSDSEEFSDKEDWETVNPTSSNHTISQQPSSSATAWNFGKRALNTMTRIGTAAVQLAAQGAGYIYTNHVKGKDDPIRTEKYISTLNQLKDFTQQKGQQQLKAKIAELQDNTLLRDLCLDIYKNLEAPISKPRATYKKFVRDLRKAEKLSSTLNEQHPCLICVESLATFRFKIRSDTYNDKLVTKETGAFTQPITLDNFWEEFEQRSKKLKDGELPLIAQAATEVRNNVVEYDPLTSPNLPSLYGTMTKGTETITVIRHPSPVVHDSAGSAPHIAEDFTAFVRAAGHTRKNQDVSGVYQNILHCIFEDADKAVTAVNTLNEKGRTQVRLDQAATRPNFYPIALRMDGEFFHPHSYETKTIEDVKVAFIGQLLGDFDKTGYSIPDKVRVAYKKKTGKNFKDAVETCMKDVQETYFHGQTSFDTLGEYQAFMLLTYVRIVQLLMDTLGIAILAALCKEDIDRGAVFKVILVLDHLYRTNNLTPDRLQDLLVNFIVHALAAKKRRVLHSRAILVHHVLKVLQRAVKSETKNKSGFYKGDFTFRSA